MLKIYISLIHTADWIPAAGSGVNPSLLLLVATEIPSPLQASILFLTFKVELPEFLGCEAFGDDFCEDAFF